MMAQDFRFRLCEFGVQDLTNTPCCLFVCLVTGSPNGNDSTAKATPLNPQQGQ